MEPTRIGNILPQIPSGSGQIRETAAPVKPATLRPAPSNLKLAKWAEVRPALRDVIRSTDELKAWPLLIHGGRGNGKSCAAVGVYQRWPKVAHWYGLGQLVRDFQTCRTSKDKVVRHNVQGMSVFRTEANLWELVDNPRSLWCIDDVGTKKASESASEIFGELIDRRTGMPTILTSNFGLSELAKLYDARTIDRLNAGTVFELTGDSLREGRHFRG